jgi:hypothetical protein
LATDQNNWHGTSQHHGRTAAHPSPSRRSCSTQSTAIFGASTALQGFNTPDLDEPEFCVILALFGDTFALAVLVDCINIDAARKQATGTPFLSSHSRRCLLLSPALKSSLTEASYHYYNYFLTKDAGRLDAVILSSHVDQGYSIHLTA